MRLRPMMIAAILEKASYVITLGVLYAAGRLEAGQIGPAGPDLLLGCLFVAAFLKTREPAGARVTAGPG
jgi:hypothetical protein